MSGATQRVHLQPAYVLHHRPFRDTSRILECFTRDYGRLTLFARGTRGPKSKKTAMNALAAVLQPFHRALFSYSSKGEAGQLHGAEFDGEFHELPAARTLSGYYLNELLLRLFERHDAHADVFKLYDATVTQLKVPANDESVLLRVFEKRLLEMIGYGVQLDRESSTDVPVQADAVYRYTPEKGLTRLEGVAEGDLVFKGASLLALHAESLKEATVKSDARRLLRAALDQYLSGRDLKSREVLGALKRLQVAGRRETGPR